MVPTLYQGESSGKNGPSSNGESVSTMKKSMTLDFNSSGVRQNQFQSMLANSPADMQNVLKLASPDFEKILVQNGVMATTPTPSQFMYSKYVTDEQEAYARGFLVALDELHKEDTTTAPAVPPNTYSTLQPATNAAASTAPASVPAPAPATATTASIAVPVSTSSSVGSVNSNSTATENSSSSNGSRGIIQQPPRPMSVEYAPSYSSSGDSYSPITVKEEPHTGPGSPSMSPINMEDQECQKLERKRARNRIAARKCRTRKLERINRLEDKVSDLKGTNHDLAQTANTLREQVHQLKAQIMDHVKSGCSIMMDPSSCMM